MDEESRAWPDGRQRAERALLIASEWMDQACAVSLRIRASEDWVSDDTAPDIESLYESVPPSDGVDGCDVTIALVGQRGALREPPYARVGWAPWFGELCVIRMGETEREQLIAGGVAHEMLHLFGAWHSAESTSIMFRRQRDLRLATVDSATAGVLRVTRLMDFRAGIDCLRGPDIEELTRLYRASPAPDGEFPIAETFLDRADEAANDEAYDEAMRWMDRAITLYAGVKDERKVSLLGDERSRLRLLIERR